MVEKICKVCGKRFFVINYRGNIAQFCSKKCCGINLTKRKAVTCQFCKKEFYTRPWKADRQKFCSLACRYASKKGKPFGKPYKKGEHSHPSTEFKKGEQLREKHPFWKGGIVKAKGGYLWKLSPSHPHNNHGYVLEHRLVMEEHLGRYLEPQEIVHHINRNIIDNRIENLMLFPNNSAHTKFHKNLKKNSHFLS